MGFSSSRFASLTPSFLLLSQLLAQNFSDCRFGKRIPEFHNPGDFIGRQLFTAKGDNLIGRGRLVFAADCFGAALLAMTGYSWRLY